MSFALEFIIYRKQDGNILDLSQTTFVFLRDSQRFQSWLNVKQHVNMNAFTTFYIRKRNLNMQEVKVIV